MKVVDLLKKNTIISDSSFGSLSQLLCFKDFMKNNTTVTIGTGERVSLA